MRLSPNNTEVFKVSSRKAWNETEVEVLPDEEYEFLAIGKWRNLFGSSEANGFSNVFMRPFNMLKRAPHNWFALIGSINKKFDFLIGGQNRVKCETAGKLSFYANGVPGLYWNHSRSISVFITRIR